MTVRIEWKSDFRPNYTMYSTEHYVVCKVGDDVQLLLDGAGAYVEHNILLSKGSVAYVMNDKGATVDTIRP